MFFTLFIWCVAYEFHKKRMILDEYYEVEGAGFNSLTP